MSKHSLSTNTLLPKGIQFLSFNDADALVTRLAAQIGTILRTAITQKGYATIAVSGGRTPQPLFAALSKLELAWDKVTITLVDERWLAPDHPQSNARLVHQYLLQNHASKARFIPLYQDDTNAESAVAERNAALSAMPLPLDIAILGMGEDGHTASFFPHAPQLHEALDSEQPCCFVNPPEAPFERITLTLKTLLKTPHLFLHISGAAKLPVLVSALEGSDTLTMPVRALLHQQVQPMQIFWSP